MGRLKDLALALQTRVTAHNVVVASAGIAFFALLASVPALVVVVSVYGLVADPDDIADQVDRLGDAVPEEARDLITSQLESITGSSGGSLTVGVVVGTALALFSASSAMKNLMNTLNVAEEVVEGRSFVPLRALAVLYTLGAVVVVAGALYVLTVLPAALADTGLGDATRVVVGIVRFPLLGAVMTGALVVLYHHAPDREPAGGYRDRLPGALFATVAWVVASALFSAYTANFASYNETYGALGAVIVVMVWLQITALVVIVGAEINAHLAPGGGADSPSPPSAS